MKSYLQGMITGGVLVFATIVFMGATNKGSQIGKYQLEINGQGAGLIFRVLDTSNGQLYNWIPLSRKWKKSVKPVQD